MATYIYQSITEGVKVNALADVMFEEAIDEARERDKDLREGIVRGVLHGIPVSVKDMIKSKGTSATCGMAIFVDRIATEDGALIKAIRENGGIPFVKTNVPQLLMIPETINSFLG